VQETCVSIVITNGLVTRMTRVIDNECRGYSYYEVSRWKINIERDERAADSS